MKAAQALGLTLEARTHLEIEHLGEENAHIFEATLAPRSHMVGRTLKGIRFRDQFGFTALAIRRQGEVIHTRLRDVKLQFGDALLLQGPRHRLRALQEGNEFLVLEPVTILNASARSCPSR